VTVSLIIANAGVFIWQINLVLNHPELAEGFINRMGLVPAALMKGGVRGNGGYITVFSSMFLHGDGMHIAGNMLYLWIFGNNIEDSMGHLRFIVFYFVVGLTAAVAHIFLNPASTVPTIGASGAVSGILGAYLVLFPRARVRTLIPLIGPFFRIVRLPAWALLLFWIAFQILHQVIVPTNAARGGVAYAAHIGGFAAGFVLILFFRKYRRRVRYS